MKCVNLGFTSDQDVSMASRRKRRYVPDLVRDMAECDANYLRLCRLFPDMVESDSVVFGVTGTTNDGALVEIAVLERCPFTSMLSVRVTSEEDTPWLRWPKLEVRMYHDVKSAEVTSFERHSRFAYRYEYPNKNLFQPDEKSQINRYLGELLAFCLGHGHSLETLSSGNLQGERKRR